MNKNKIGEKQATYKGICPNCGGILECNYFDELVLICNNCDTSIDSDGGIIN